MDRETELAELDARMRHHYRRSMQFLLAMASVFGFGTWVSRRVPMDDWGAGHWVFLVFLWAVVLVMAGCCGWHIGQELRLERRKEEIDEYVP